MVATAATAVVVGLGAVAAPTAFAAPTVARVEAGSPVVTGWAPAGRAALHPRRRHRHRRRRYLHRQLRVHRGQPGVPRAARTRRRRGHEQRLQLGHPPARHRGGDPGLRRRDPSRGMVYSSVGRNPGRRRPTRTLLPTTTSPRRAKQGDAATSTSTRTSVGPTSLHTGVLRAGMPCSGSATGRPGTATRHFVRAPARWSRPTAGRPQRGVQLIPGIPRRLRQRLSHPERQGRWAARNAESSHRCRSATA